MKSSFRFASGLLFVAVSLAAFAPARSATPQQSDSSSQFVSASDQTPLTPGEIHDLVVRAIANQHRDDAALDSFERLERHVMRSGGADSRITDDKTYRVVPTGSGNIKLLVKNADAPVPASDYRRELNTWQGILNVAVHPNDARQVADAAKQQKKLKDRAYFVDSALRAFTFSWLARDLSNGRTLERLHFDPNPHYVPQGNSADWLVHARATVWIDAETAQVVRIEADIIRDISIGAGILGKVYKGGHFVLAQAEASPGIWEPSLYEYDFSGRKFLFPFKMREVTEVSRYRYIGSPNQALAIARKDLSAGGTFSNDP